MKLQSSIFSLLDQLQQVLDTLSDHQYASPVASLSDATIGQHVRHVIEFFQELSKGYDCGFVNYDGRKRDHSIETSRQTAIHALQTIDLLLVRPDKELWLVADAHGEIRVKTNYHRELLYNLEHLVHHMALMRVGVEAVSSVVLPISFGVAASTLKFRQECAQ
ncbi:MAG: DinB family protein [Bacteroidetes bacterium]|nr:DinB family protein [Bacteroidota bacterium]